MTSHGLRRSTEARAFAGRYGAVMHRSPLVFSCAVVLATLAADRAEACFCVAPSGDGEPHPVEEAEEVFVGTVVDAAVQSEPACDPAGAPSTGKYLIEVSRVWRGEVGRRVILVTDAASSCVASLDVGEQHVFTPILTPDGLRHVSSCGGYHAATLAEDYRDVLGEGAEPSSTSESLPDCPAGEPEEVSGGCSVTSACTRPELGALLLALLAVRRRRPRRL